MVKSCCVFQCHNKANQIAKDKKISFFRFPQNKRKRTAWVKAIKRADFTPNAHTKICSVHFVDGWHSDDPVDANYAPTLFSYKTKVQTPAQVSREDRLVGRKHLKESIAWATEIEVAEKNAKKFSLFAHSYCAEEQTGSPNQCSLPDDTDTEVQLVNSGTQCDADPLQLENIQLKRELEEANEELKRYRWGVNKIKDNDALTKFYTGLPTFSIFLWLYDYLSSKSTRMTYWKGEGNSSSDRVKMYSSKLHPVDQLLAVLMRLKLGLFVQDLADRFNISVASFSMYFTTWINLLHLELKLLNPFPARDIIDRTMPLSFKSKYKSTRVIIDCTEIYIQRSTSLVNQSLTFSNYKHHNTLKFLVGITPCGVISFVSEAWGGRVSDRQLTAECGLLDLLEPGDSVMADKGFTISDLLEKRKCRLNIPPFRGNSDQFSTEEVYQTQEIAQLRIHVERSIGRVKNFHLLDGVLPLSIAPLATQIFKVCWWLTNLDVPLVID